MRQEGKVCRVPSTGEISNLYIYSTVLRLRHPAISKPAEMDGKTTREADICEVSTPSFVVRVQSVSPVRPIKPTDFISNRINRTFFLPFL